MCDFSLEAVRSWPAKVGDKLTTHTFNWGTRGFCAPEDPGMAFASSPALSCRSRRASGVGDGAMVLEGDQLSNRHLQTGQQGEDP